MKLDDIIRMAHQADCLDPEHYGSLWVNKLKSFASLVAAFEREKIARWMMANEYATGDGDSTEDLLAELKWQIEEVEREECALVAKEYLYYEDGGSYGIDDALRNRLSPESMKSTYGRQSLISAIKDVELIKKGTPPVEMTPEEASKFRREIINTALKILSENGESLPKKIVL